VARRRIAVAIGNIAVSEEGRRLMASGGVKEALVRIGRGAGSDDVRATVCHSIETIAGTDTEEGRAMFVSEDVVGVLVEMGF
jgi:hypothetical protein